MKLIRVDLPAPVRPTMPTEVPSGMRSETFSRTGFAAPGCRYVRLRISTSPRTGPAGFTPSGSRISGTSSRSAWRRPSEAFARSQSESTHPNAIIGQTRSWR